MPDYTVKYRVHSPDIPGVDLIFPTRHHAEREAAKATKAGFPSTVSEVMCRVRPARNTWAA